MRGCRLLQGHRGACIGRVRVCVLRALRRPGSTPTSRAKQVEDTGWCRHVAPSRRIAASLPFLLYAVLPSLLTVAVPAVLRVVEGRQVAVLRTAALVCSVQTGPTQQQQAHGDDAFAAGAAVAADAKHQTGRCGKVSGMEAETWAASWQASVLRRAHMHVPRTVTWCLCQPLDKMDIK